MNEQFRPNTELTHGAVSHTLDMRSIMPEPTEPQPSRPDTRGLPPGSPSNIDERQVMRILLEARSAQLGRPLTPDEQMEFLGRINGAAGRENTPRDNTRNSRGEEVYIQGAQDIRTDNITHPDLIKFIDRLNLKLEYPEAGGSRALQRALEDLFRIDAPIEQLRIARENIELMRRGTEEAGQRGEAGAAQDEYDADIDHGFTSFVLQGNDREKIRNQGGLIWLDEQFDNLYRLAKSGELLDSPQVQAIQNKFNDAYSYLQYLQENGGNSITDDSITELLTTYGIRTNLIFARASVDRRNLEGIQGSVQRLRATGMLTALSLDEGRAGVMFNRMIQMVNDTRIREGTFEYDKHGNIVSERQHLTNEIVNTIRQDLQKEQFQLAIKGVGAFADKYNVLLGPDGANDPAKVAQAKKLLEIHIVRAVNVAYDVYGVSQQQAVTAARGRGLDENSSYRWFSDSQSIFDMFNIEEFLTNKWGTFNHAQMEFLKRIKLDLARHEAKGVDTSKMTEDQLEELGTRLFRDLFAVPDFFSSSWRIQGTLDQIQEVELYHAYNAKIAEDILQGANRFRSGSEPESELKAKVEAERVRIEAEINGENLSNVQKENKRKELWNKYLISKEFSLNDRELYLSRFNFNPAQKTVIALAAKEKAEGLALFMRVKAADGKNSTEVAENRTAAWEKIKDLRPEEIIKLVRERKGKIGEFSQLDEIDKIFKDRGILDEHRTDDSGRDVKIRAHDVFRRDYLPVLSIIREEALHSSPPQAVNFKNLSPEQKAKINQALRKDENDGFDYADRVKLLYEDMGGFIDRKGIVKRFVTSSEYEDLYTRVLNVDDTILEQLEVLPENMGEKKLRVSEHWSAENGADALFRTFGDLAAGQQAGNKLVAFFEVEGVKDEYSKLALEFAHFIKQYNGLDGAAKGFRYTFGSYLLVAEQNYLADLTGLGKLPFRLNSSDIEKIFGHGVEPQTREELLKTMDHIRGHLETNDHSDPEKYYNQLVALLGVDTFNMGKDRAITIGIYAILLMLLLAPATGVLVATEATKK